MAQRLLDEYNDSCAVVQEQSDVVAVISRCRDLVHDRRLNHVNPPTATFSKSDIAALLALQDSWDDPGSALRLAPEVAFLIGAGIEWDLVEAKDFQLTSTLVSGRGTGAPDSGNPLVPMTLT